MTFSVLIQTEDFDVSREVAALRSGKADVGAVCVFVGTVRDRNDGDDVSTLELEHYPGMTEKSIERMLNEAQQRFEMISAKVIPSPYIILENLVFIILNLVSDISDNKFVILTKLF